MLLMCLSIAAMQAQGFPPEIEDPSVLGINKRSAHATFRPYGSMQEALTGLRAKSSLARSLNGKWKFNYVPRPELRPVDFYKPSFDVSKWKDIPVPSNWQVEGYGTPYYRNAGYIFQRDFPHVMSEPPRNFTAYEERNPVGSYRRTFTVPAAWSGQHIILSFDGVDSAFFLWVNGQKVGYSQNSRNVAEFDITPYVKKGENVLAVEVYRFSAGSYFEDQDMWRLSGIFRNVTLWAEPVAHIEDFKVETDLDAQYRNGTLRVIPKLSAEAANHEIKLSLFDDKQNLVASLEGPAAGTKQIVVPSPKKWSAEQPNLYTLVIQLQKGGKVVETLSQKVGFRKVEIKGRIFMVNGEPVKLKGANRHEHWPDTGHYVSEERMIEDIKVLKQANCNHVRTCHYSDDPRWYELCDEYGLYLVAEANAECHGYYGVLDSEPTFEKMVVDRNVANVQNFKNHASVLIWSLGNECGGGSNFKSALTAIQKLDQTRPTHYEPFGIGKDNPASIDSRMYTDPAGTEGIAQDSRLTKPFYLCEYAHAMNNSMGSIGDYNDVFDKYPSLMGGAIWEWEDQGLWNTRKDPKKPFLAYGGGFGDFPNDGYFIHKGVVFSDRSPKPHYPEAKRAYQWIGFKSVDANPGKVMVKNKFAFTNLKDFDFSYRVSANGKVVTSGSIPPIDLAPAHEKLVTFDIPNLPRTAGVEYFLDLSVKLRRATNWAPAGHEIAHEQLALPFAASPTRLSAASSGPVTLAEDPSGVTITAGAMKLTFDRTNGLAQIREGDKDLLVANGGPKLHLWRAQHRNDDGYASRDWDRGGLRDLDRKILNLAWQRVGPNEVQVTLSTQYNGRSGFAATHIENYTVYGDGSVAVDNAVSTFGPTLIVARMGVRMEFDRSMQDLRYFARGPMENYADRKRGSDLRIYASTVDKQLTPYPKPMECGNHEDMRWLALAAGSTSLMVQSEEASPLQFSAIPYRDEVMEPTDYSVNLPPSDSTVLCIGTKTLGVGSASCGPRPLPQYIVNSAPARFSYVLRPIPSGKTAEEIATTLPPKRTGVLPLVRLVNGDLTVDAVGTKAQYRLGEGAAMPFQGQIRPYAKGESEDVPVTVTTAPDSVSAGTRFLLPVPPARRFDKIEASSFEPGEGDPIHAADGDPSTYWHSRWNPKVNPPHSLTLMLAKPIAVATIRIVPRQDMSNGRIKDYEILASADGKKWESVTTGSFPDSPRPQVVKLPKPMNLLYWRIVAKSDHSGGGFGAIAEIEMLP